MQECGKGVADSLGWKYSSVVKDGKVDASVKGHPLVSHSMLRSRRDGPQILANTAGNCSEGQLIRNLRSVRAKTMGDGSSEVSTRWTASRQRDLRSRECKSSILVPMIGLLTHSCTPLHSYTPSPPSEGRGSGSMDR